MAVFKSFPGHLDKEYSISFIEEGVLNPDYRGYVAGRVEVGVENEPYAVEEIRFLTDRREEFHAFREKWDLRDVNQEQLDEIRNAIKEKYYDSPDLAGESKG